MTTINNKQLKMCRVKENMTLRTETPRCWQGQVNRLVCRRLNGTAGIEPTRGQRQQAEQTIAALPSVRSLANNIEQKTGRTASAPSSAVPKPAGSFTIRAGSGPPQVSPVRIAQKGGAAAATGKVDRPSQERHKRVLTTLEVKQPPPQRPQVEKPQFFVIL